MLQTASVVHVRALTAPNAMYAFQVTLPFEHESMH